MRIVSVRIEDIKRITIPIGFVGENLHTRVVIDAEKIFAQYPDAVATMTVKQPYGEAYPAIVTRDGNAVVWNVADSDLTQEGQGEFQLKFTVGGVIAHSCIGSTRVARSIVPTGDIPEPIEDWLEEAEEALSAIQNMTASAETLEAGSSATAEMELIEGHKNLLIGVPRGPQGVPGQDGQDGQDGYSPSAGVSKAGNTATITITDKNGTTTANVSDGQDGQDGQDGVTPNVTAGTTTTLEPGNDATVTRRSGSPDSAPIFDFGIPKGAKGDPGEVTEAELLAGLATKAAIIEDSVESSAVASFLDGADNMPMKVSVTLEPIQDLHGYDSPWPAGGGVNKLNLFTFSPWTDAFGLTTTINNDESISITGTVTESGTQRLQWRILSAPTGFDPTGLTFIGFNLPSGKTINFRYDSTLNTIVIDVSNLTQGESVNWKIYILAYEGSTAPTAWTPYSNICPISGRTGCEVKHSGADTTDPTTYPISWQTEAGTVYGGTLTVNKDGTGTLVVDRASVTFPNNHSFILETNQNRRRFEFSTPDYGLIKNALNSKSSHFKLGRPEYASFGYFYLAGSTSTLYYTFYDGDSRFATVSEFEAWLQDQATNGTPVQATFELATPVTYTLSDLSVINSLIGVNNVWSDGGNCAVEYSCNTKLYIDKKIASLGS